MKSILLLHKNGRTLVNPQHCQHQHTMTIQTGHQYTIMGEATDNIKCYEQCLMCGWVMRGDRTWGPHHDEFETTQIPF